MRRADDTANLMCRVSRTFGCVSLLGLSRPVYRLLYIYGLLLGSTLIEKYKKKKICVYVCVCVSVCVYIIKER